MSSAKVLIQLLLPLTSPDVDDLAAKVAQTRTELVEAFGGVTAYVQTPAHGVWTSPDGHREHDEVVMVELVTAHFDRGWWEPYSQRLKVRFKQDAMHVRATAIEVLDEDAS
jgi:hypothetical protein